MFDLVIPCTFFAQSPFTLRFKEQTMLHIIILVKAEDLFFLLPSDWVRRVGSSLLQQYSRRTRGELLEKQTSHLITTGTT